MPSAVNGFSVAYTAAGGIILWSGIKGSSISDTVRSVLAGSTSPPVTEQISGATTSGTTTTGTAAPPTTVAAPSTATETANQATAKLMAASYGWYPGAQWTALNSLVMAESGWNSKAQNPSSTAYGIGQFLDTTWATVGYTKSSDPVVQIAAMLAYIRQRYGTPEAAWAFHLANGYY